MTAVDIEFDVDGVVAGLKRAQDRLQTNVPKSLELAADLVAVEARQHHTYTDRTSVLTNSIESDGVNGTFGGDLHATVSAGAAHGIYVEKDTRAHKIKPRHRKALKFPGANGFIFAAGVDHPGTTGTHFLENALTTKLPQVTRVLEQAVEASFDEAGFGT